MHATQHQDQTRPEPTRHSGGSSPATDVDRRFIDLVSSDDAAEIYGQNELDYDRLPTVEGFTAWCAKQAKATDGYVVTETGLQALAEAVSAEAPGTAAQVLRDAALYLQRHGWIQGAYYDATSLVFTPAACMVGAIGMVCYGGPVDAPAQHFDDPGFLDFEEAVLHLDRYLLAMDGTESYEFNDARGRRAEDVLHVLRQAADTPAHELIDAIRAIDAKNADVAALAEQVIPCATWDDPVVGDDNDADTNVVDCLLCGAPGGYPYCHGSYGAQTSCADVVADDAEQAAQDADVR